jgi:hypothetical protein
LEKAGEPLRRQRPKEKYGSADGQRMSRIWVHVRPPAASSKIVMASLSVVLQRIEGAERTLSAGHTKHGEQARQARQARGLDTRAHKHSASGFQGDQAKAIVEAKDAQNLSVR